MITGYKIVWSTRTISATRFDWAVALRGDELDYFLIVPLYNATYRLSYTYKVENEEAVHNANKHIDDTVKALRLELDYNGILDCDIVSQEATS